MRCYFGLIISRSTAFILGRLYQFILVIKFTNSVFSFILLCLILFENTTLYTELWSYSIRISDIIYFLKHRFGEMGAIFHYCIRVSWHRIEGSTILYYFILLFIQFVLFWKYVALHCSLAFFIFNGTSSMLVIDWVRALQVVRCSYLSKFPIVARS